MTGRASEYIKQLIRSEGRITFARFMDIALYHPEFGYYSVDRPKIGKTGDYYTSSDVHPFMGQALGSQLMEMWNILGKGDFCALEMGAGKGLMALDIMEYIKENLPEFYECLTYIIIEKSPSFKIKQFELLTKRFKEKVQWLDSLSCFNDSKGFTGCVISNELVDALPFHRVCQDGNELKELYVAIDQERFAEQTGDLSTDRLINYIKRLQISLADGMKTEINLEAMDWIKNVASILQKGFVITIDYGLPAYLYYAPSRNRGTFLCYYRHSTNEEPFARIGEQDITAHVEFTSLALEGIVYGLDPLAYTDTSMFLVSYGKDILEKEMGRIQSLSNIKAFKTSAAIKNLIHPEGIGGTLKVLIQGKDVDKESLKESLMEKLSNRTHLLGLK